MAQAKTNQKETARTGRTGLRTGVFCVLAAACVVLAVVMYTSGAEVLEAWASLAFAGAVGACVLVSLSVVLNRVQYNVTGLKHTTNLAFTGMLAALVFIGFYLTIRLPGSVKAQVGFGNVFCIFSGLMLGPVYGGLSAGIGGFLYDLLNGWADSSVTTLVTKFVMAFVCGLLAWGIQGRLLREDAHRHVGRVVLAAVCGSVAYSVLYLLNGFVEGALLGNAAGALQVILAEKLAVTVINAVIADVIAVPLFFAIRSALKRNHLAFV